MALQPLSPPLPVPPPPSPSPSGGLGGVGQVRGGRHTPTEDLSPSLLQEGKGSGCRPLLMKPEGGFPDGGSPARPGRGGEWGEPWPCCEVGSCCKERIFLKRNRGSRREAGNHRQHPIACRERLRHCGRTRRRFSTSWSWGALRGWVGVCKYDNSV